MSALRDLQADFRRSLLSPPGAEAPPALLAAIAGRGLAPERRLAVYRDSVQGSLIEVLAAAFPATRTLAGRDNFRYAARRFLCQAPPAEARLLTYGAGFPAWLAAFAPAAGRPWLAEMARLEWARNEALFAADADPLDPGLLARLPAERVGALRFEPHPATRLLAVGHDLEALWQAPAEGAVPPVGRQWLLVVRPALAVQHHRLSPGEAALTQALLARALLAEAAAAGLALEPALDLEACLFRHLSRGSFRAWRLDQEGEESDDPAR